MRPEEFCDQALKAVPRATSEEREDIKKELQTHLEDRIEGLTEKGWDREEAQDWAVQVMGDPAEIGRAFNEQLSPFWLWVKRAAVVLVVFFGVVLLHFGLELLFSDYYEPGPIQIIGEQLAIRRGELPEVEPSDEAVCFWRSGQEMQVGKNMVRLEAVELVPVAEGAEVYQGRFTFCVYHRDLWREATDGFMEHLTVTTETGSAGVEGADRDEGHKVDGWFKSYRIWACEALVVPEDTYVDVSCDCYGLQREMRCPLRWEEDAP